MIRTTTPLAVLDAELTRRLADWPSILGQLAARTVRRSSDLEIRVAITQLPPSSCASNCSSGISPTAGDTSAPAA